MKAEVDRILQSDTLRNAEALKRLLVYLADKSESGEADQLKEYTIGLDAFGKPPGYDPRQDSIVRLQVGRLRQKLAEYYLTEGRNDSVVVELPKGHFKLRCETRPQAAVAESPAAARPWRRRALMLAAALCVAVAWATISTIRLWRQEQLAAPMHAAWTPELEALWAPFLAVDRPLVVSIGSPLFVLLGNGRLYRDMSINRWEDALVSPGVAAVRRALQDPPVQPRHHFVPADELNAAFLIEKLLGPRKQNISLAKSTQLSLQQLETNNMLLVGSPALFDALLGSLPFEREFIQERGGIRNLHPRAGEPAFFADQHATGSSEDGEVYTLITHAPGPLGNGDVASFTSSTTPGRLTAVQWVTDPALARSLTTKLRGADGKLPRYYQVVLKAKFMDTVPVETSYITHRGLRISARLPVEGP